MIPFLNKVLKLAKKIRTNIEKIIVVVVVLTLNGLPSYGKNKKIFEGNFTLLIFNFKFPCEITEF